MALAARAISRTEQTYRSAPQNVEAEQALLGAILVNNEAFYRVSDFLEPNHFFEPVHRRIYQVAGELIRANKIANPVTIKTFLPADLAIGDITLAQYLARLAAEATTIINAEDYGRTVYDLALRRALIGIGEDMVNVAYDAPVEMTPRDQIEEAEKRLYELAEKGQLRRRLPCLRRRRSSPPSTWRAPPTSATAIFRASRPASPTSTGRWAACSRRTSSSSPAARAWARRALATNIAFNIAKAWRGEVQPDGTTKTVERRHRRLLLARNVVRAARHPHHRRAVGRALVRHPARPHHRGPVRRDRRGGARDAARCRSTSTRPAV